MNSNLIERVVSLIYHSHVKRNDPVGYATSYTLVPRFSDISSFLLILQPYGKGEFHQLTIEQDGVIAEFTDEDFSAIRTSLSNKIDEQNKELNKFNQDQILKVLNNIVFNPGSE